MRRVHCALAVRTLFEGLRQGVKPYNIRTTVISSSTSERTWQVLASLICRRSAFQMREQEDDMQATARLAVIAVMIMVGNGLAADWPQYLGPDRNSIS